MSVSIPDPESHGRKKIMAVTLRILVKRPAFLSVSLQSRYAYCEPEVRYVSDVILQKDTSRKPTFVANFKLVKVSLRWA